MTLTIKETDHTDLPNVMRLWNTGDVMRDLGFPDGLGITIGRLERWLDQLDANPDAKHFSLYHDTLGYVGETSFCLFPEDDSACLDVKLLPHARGRGIAREALSHTIDHVVETGKVTLAYAELNPMNQPALTLYERLGFCEEPIPIHLEDEDTFEEEDTVYLELSLAEWTHRLRDGIH